MAHKRRCCTHSKDGCKNSDLQNERRVPNSLRLIPLRLLMPGKTKTGPMRMPSPNLKEDYLNELARDCPEDTSLNEIVVPDQDVGLHILNDVLGVKPGRQIRGLGDGRVRELGASTSWTSLRAHQLEEELAEERAARQAADAAREAADRQILASDTARAAAKQTLAVMMQTWQHAMIDLAARVPGWEPPSLIIPPETQLDQHVAHDENYNENE